jgi:hypothetical protein
LGKISRFVWSHARLDSSLLCKDTTRHGWRWRSSTKAGGAPRKGKTRTAILPSLYRMFQQHVLWGLVTSWTDIPASASHFK